MNLKQMKALAVKNNSRKLIEGNIDYLCDPGAGVLECATRHKRMGYVKIGSSEGDPRQSGQADSMSRMSKEHLEINTLEEQTTAG